MSWMDNIEKASGVTKAILFLIVIIGGGVGAYYKIYDNADSIILINQNEKRDKESLENKIKESELNLQKELNLQSNRADKRYNRAMKIAEDHENRLRELEKTIIYIKGKEGY